MKLKYKLFIAFFISSFIIVFLVVGLTQFNVRKNFIRFVNNTEFDKQKKMVTLLRKSYQTHNGWAEFKGNVAAWEALFSKARPDDPAFPPIQGLPAGHPEPPPGPRGKGLKHFSERPPKKSPNPLDPFSFHLRLCLFDADKNYVAGNFKPGDQFHYREILFSGQIIGFLGLKNQPQVIKPIELEFLKNQTQSFYAIALAILILAGCLSYLMSRHLLSPIRNLTQGTKAIRKFDFKTKINVNSNDELGELAMDFNLMSQTLNEYETLRKNWVSDISHELRTPVAVIRSKIEALQDGVRTLTGEFLDSLHADILGMGKLVNDLHLISLADSKNLPFHPVRLDVTALANNCLDTFIIRFEQKRIRVQADQESQTPVLVNGDSVLLTRVFNNLLENSFRYTYSPGTIRISREIKKDRLFMSIEDSAPGVPDNAFKMIFKRLYRIEQSRNRALGGSGLGLSLVRQILVKHGGAVSAGPSDLGGLKIKIELPISKK